MFTDTFSELQRLFGERITTSEEVLQDHSKDYSSHAAVLPEAVFYPKDEEEVCELVKICARHRTPIVPFGAGSSLEGGVLPVHGGVSVDFSRMDRILRVSAEDRDATVQAGARRLDLNERLEPLGLFFPVDPGANATLAGMAATRASGTNAVRYGTMRENVVSMKVVLADGSLIRTGSRAWKSAAGYDLTRLFIGSEGSLGIITEVTVRLHPKPAFLAAAVVSFPNIERAIEAVVDARIAGLPMARIELLDGLMMKGINRHAGMDHPEKPTLFLEFNGSEREVKDQVGQFESLVAERAGGHFVWAVEAEDREHLWHARHNAHYAALALRPGCKAVATDVCVPLSRLSECIQLIRADLVESSIMAPLVGHVGEGNFHLQYLIDPNDPVEAQEAERLHSRLVQVAISMDGTCTGEHGIGMGKMEYLKLEYGPAYGLLQTLKATLDPLNIMNPGKVIPM